MRRLFFIIPLLILIVLVVSISLYPTPTPSPTSTSTTTPTPMSTPTPTSTPTSTPTPTPTRERYFFGHAAGPLGLAITSDGKTAYIPFSLDDTLLAVNLSTFTMVSIDVSSAGTMLQSESAILSPDNKKLYVSNFNAGNVMVVDTENKCITKVLPLRPAPAVAITLSRDGSKVYVSSDDGALYVVNTADDSYQRIFIPGVIFGPVAPSPSDPDLLFTVGHLQTSPETFQPSFLAFDVPSNTVLRSSDLGEVLPPYASHTFARRLVVDSNGTAAYFGWLNLGTDKGIGNFSVFDLNAFQLLASAPMDYGVSDFAVSEGTDKIYIIGFWSGGAAPNELPILEYDIATNEVVRRIPLTLSSDQRAIAIDPTNPDYLYETDGDWQLLRKVQISTGKEIARALFNEAEIRPYAIIRGDNNTGYITCTGCEKVYKLDLASGQLMGSIPLPQGVSRAGGYYQGKLYFSDGRYVHAINPSDGSVIETFDIGMDFHPITLTFFNDRMVTVDFDPGGMVGRRLLFFDAGAMSILKSIELPSEPHGDKVIVSPDGSKLYVERGLMMGGTTTITIFDASTLEITNTIEIPPSDLMRSGATGFVEGDFDETNRILYLTGFVSIYKIDMDTDELIGVLDLMDVYESQNIRGWSPCGLSGVVLSPAKDKLFVISGDAHSMYVYDLTTSSWATKITNLKGYFITDAVTSPDRKYLYTVNSRSDSVTLVDLASGDIVRIIRLEEE